MGETTGGAIPAEIAAIRRPIGALWNYYLLKGVMSLFAAPFVLPVLYFRFETMRYSFDAEGIRKSWGLLFRNEVVLNYSRIQDIHLHSNFIERILGLARIEIQTAAGSSGAEITLEGLADTAAMRDFLYAKMRGAKGIEAGKPATELETVLGEVAQELRAIRGLLETGAKHV